VPWRQSLAREAKQIGDRLVRTEDDSDELHGATAGRTEERVCALVADQAAQEGQNLPGDTYSTQGSGSRHEPPLEHAGFDFHRDEKKITFRINLDWPTQITETKFFELVNRFPHGKAYSFLSEH